MIYKLMSYLKIAFFQMLISLYMICVYFLINIQSDILMIVILLNLAPFLIIGGVLGMTSQITIQSIIAYNSIK